MSDFFLSFFALKFYKKKKKNQLLFFDNKTVIVESQGVSIMKIVFGKGHRKVKFLFFNYIERRPRIRFFFVFGSKTKNIRWMHSRKRLRITGKSLCRYQRETRRPRMRVASQLKLQRTLAYRPLDMTSLCVCGHSVSTINSLSYRTSAAAAAAARSTTLRCTLLNLWRVTGRTKIGLRRGYKKKSTSK